MRTGTTNFFGQVVRHNRNSKSRPVSSKPIAKLRTPVYLTKTVTRIDGVSFNNKESNTTLSDIALKVSLREKMRRK